MPAWAPTATQTAPWGRLQVVIGNVDVTFYRDVPAIVESWSSADPFGDASCVIRFPQITPFDFIDQYGGSGPVPWLAPGKPVDLRVVRSNGTVADLWVGVLVSVDEHLDGTSYGVTAQCAGVLYQADLTVKPPRFEIEPRDIGIDIAETLNGVQSRNYAPLAPVTTGILTHKRGAWTPRLTGHIQDLLNNATTRSGDNSWTLMHEGRVPVLRVKDRTTVHATYITGQPGLRLRLSQDVTQTPNVIFGSGVSPDGCWWGNSKYPNLRADDTPVYPLGASVTFTPGSSTPGFQAFADELRWQAAEVYSGDTYDARDEAEVRQSQRSAGIQVDGIVGPQTWATLLQTGSNAGSLSGAYYQPLAWEFQVEERAYNVQGADIGPNPLFQPDMIRVERYVNYGEGITFPQGIEAARNEQKRWQNLGWFGTLDLEMDAPERSRFEIRAGMNVMLRHHRGVDLLLHVGKSSVSWDSGSVSLTVDTHARDLMSLASLIQRDRASADDPARRNSPLARRSRNVRDAVTPFDCSSGAGIVPRHALRGGLWTVLRIPFGQLGQIARTEFRTDGAVTPFALGCFGKPITANDLARLVGNPLAPAAAGATSKPWNPEAEALRERGLLVAWGSGDQACGYYPGVQSDGDPLTGLFVDDATWYFDTIHPPWVWVAEYAPVSCFIQGRFYPAVET